MKVNHLSLSYAAGLLAGAMFVSVSVPVARAAAAAAEADALPAMHENFVKIGGNAPFLSGSRAGFQKSTQISRMGTGGIEEFNYTTELNKETTLQIDGRVLPGAEDYLAQFKLTKDKVGSFGAGYKRARTFYDGMGGFFPLNNSWIPLYPRALYVDRGSFFANATIALPKAPVFTFTYRNDTRSGRKDSTIWGDTDLTGVPIYRPTSLNLISSNRKIVPAYIDLGERQETWEAAVKHSFGDTSVRLAVVGTRVNNLDTRSIDRYPGELSPRPALPANPVPPLLVNPLLAANENKGFDQQGVKDNGLTWLGKVETNLSAEWKAYFSASYHHASVDTTGSRLVTAKILTDAGLTSTVGGFTPGGRSPYSQNGTGEMKLDILTGVAGLDWKPAKELDLHAALKGEDYKSTGKYMANYVTNMINLTTGQITPVSLSAPNSSKISDKPWIPEASVRYTGIKDVALWALWDYRTSPGDDRTSYVGLTTSPAAMVLAAPTGASDKVKEKHTNLKVGGNWTPNSMIMLRGEVFTKDHENSFTGYGPALGGYYILDYDTYGVRVTATVKPSPVLQFSTRYLVQRGKANIAEDGYLTGDSNDSRRYQLSESIDWNPNKLVYVQANLCLFWDTVGTVYPRAGGSANDVLHNGDNNFWNASVVTGWVIDKETDAQVQATYYKADNYNRALAVATTPYGQSGRDYSLTFGVKHKFSDRMVGSAKVGYFNSNNETSGGFANFKGTVGYLSLDYRL